MPEVNCAEMCSDRDAEPALRSGWPDVWLCAYDACVCARACVENIMKINLRLESHTFVALCVCVCERTSMYVTFGADHEQRRERVCVCVNVVHTHQLTSTMRSSSVELVNTMSVGVDVCV